MIRSGEYGDTPVFSILTFRFSLGRDPRQAGHTHATCATGIKKLEKTGVSPNT
jgi:hypothetical protein